MVDRRSHSCGRRNGANFFFPSSNDVMFMAGGVDRERGRDVLTGSIHSCLLTGGTEGREKETLWGSSSWHIHIDDDGGSDDER